MKRELILTFLVTFHCALSAGDDSPAKSFAFGHVALTGLSDQEVSDGAILLAADGGGGERQALRLQQALLAHDGYSDHSELTVRGFLMVWNSRKLRPELVEFRRVEQDEAARRFLAKGRLSDDGVVRVSKIGANVWKHAWHPYRIRIENHEGEPVRVRFLDGTPFTTNYYRLQSDLLFSSQSESIAHCNLDGFEFSNAIPGVSARVDLRGVPIGLKDRLRRMFVAENSVGLQRSRTDSDVSWLSRRCVRLFYNFFTQSIVDGSLVQAVVRGSRDSETVTAVVSLVDQSGGELSNNLTLARRQLGSVLDGDASLRCWMGVRITDEIVSELMHVGERLDSASLRNILMTVASARLVEVAVKTVQLRDGTVLVVAVRLDDVARIQKDISGLLGELVSVRMHDGVLYLTLASSQSCDLSGVLIEGGAHLNRDVAQIRLNHRTLLKDLQLLGLPILDTLVGMSSGQQSNGETKIRVSAKDKALHAEIETTTLGLRVALAALLAAAERQVSLGD